MGFRSEHPEVPDWGNSTPQGRAYRRLVTNRFGYYTFLAIAAVLIILTLFNSIFGPVLITMANEKPSRRPRQILLYLPWMKVMLWTLTLALCFFAVYDTEGMNIVYVAKRLGRMIVAAMPAMYLLTMRPSLLPRTFYLHVVSVHKFISRFVVILSVIHGLAYCYIYYSTNVFHKVYKRDNLLGIGSLFFFVGMGLTGISRLRRHFYEFFYRFHVIGAWLVLPMLHWHSRPRSDGYLLICGALMFYQVAAKIWFSCNTKLRVQYVSSTLLLIEIPKAGLRGKNWWNWSVAAHLRLSDNIINPVKWIYSSHPYTIASLPEDGSIKLVVRPGDFSLRLRRNYTIFGPHSCLPNYLLQQIHSLMVSRVLLVIGGAGIAFGAPVMRYLRMHGAQVRMVWVMRDPYDARVLPQIGLHEETLAGNIEIYYTGDARRLADAYEEDDDLTIGISESACDEHSGEMGTIRSATRHPGVASKRVRGDPLLSQYALFMANSRPHLNMRLKSWLYGYSMGANECCCADRAVDSCIEDTLGAWVMSCGNEQLSDSARSWAENAGVGYFADTFSL